MKTNYILKGTKLFTLILIAAVAFASCGKKKKKAEPVTEIKTINKSIEISLPFEGKEFQSDKEHFRAKQSGKSPDQSTSKKIALQNAKAELAGNIQATMKRVTDQYTNQRTVANKQEFENKFEELSREVVNLTLTDVKEIGTKTYLEQDGGYTTWVAVEADKQTVLNGFDQKISKDSKLQLDYDKKKFEEIFNQEMNKLANEK